MFAYVLFFFCTRIVNGWFVNKTIKGRQQTGIEVILYYVHFRHYNDLLEFSFKITIIRMVHIVIPNMSDCKNIGINGKYFFFLTKKKRK